MFDICVEFPIWSIPWYTPRSEIIKLISCKGLIEYYLGDYIKERTVKLDQISVNVSNGTGTFSDIELDCAALKKIGDKNNWPVEIVKGHMEDISVSIPWTNLFTRDTIFKVKGLSITVQPTIRTAPVSSILKWVFANWSDKKQSKTEYAPKEELEIIAQPTELFVHSINSIIKHLKVSLENTRITIEHIPEDVDRGIALIIKINRIDYYDDPTSEPVAIGTDPTNSYVFYTYRKKKIRLEGITLLTEKYPKGDMNPKREHSVHSATIENSKYPKVSIKKNIASQEEFLQKLEDKLNEPLLFATIDGTKGVTITFDQLDSTKLEAEIAGPFVVMLSPTQLDSIIEIIHSLKHP